MEMPNEFDRILIFEHARKTAEAAYVKDPLDAEVRTFFFHSIWFAFDLFGLGEQSNPYSLFFSLNLFT